MSQPLTDIQRARVREVLRSENAGAETDFEVYLDDRPTEGRHVSTTYGREDKDRPGMTAQTTLAGGIPAVRLKGRELRIVLVVGDVEIEDFRGQITFASSGTESTVQASTPGYWLDKVDIGDSPSDNRSWIDSEPGSVYAWAISRVEGYRNSRVDIEDVTSPPFSGDFTWDQTPWDILSALYEATEWFKSDTYSGGHNGRLLRSPAEATDTVWNYRGGVDFDQVEFDPEPTGNEYSSVMVTREGAGGKEPIIEVPILGSDAPERARYKIEYSGTTDPGDAEAIYQGLAAASRFEEGEARVQLEMNWVNPLVSDGDYISLDVDFDNGWEKGTRTFVAEVESSEKILPTKTHNMTLRMVRSREELDPRPEVPEIPSARVLRPLLGLGHAGQLYLDESLTFASDIGAGRLRIDLGAMASRGLTYEELTAKGLLRINY